MFDFDINAVESFLKIPGVQELEEKSRISKEDEKFAKYHERRQSRVLRVRYLCQKVQVTGFDEAVRMATPAQKEILMGLAQLREVGEFTFHARAVSAFQRMLKRWEGYVEKHKGNAAHVSRTRLNWTKNRANE